jgi:hypothetical protein
MAWIVTPALARLMADFRTAFPNKDRSSDGTIGDAAHQAETSGHNPDDTAGSRAEYSDADTTAEVRAVDADDDLRDPRGVTMEDVVQRMLRTPADLARLMYIIYNRRIWRRRNGWRQETYTGSNPHDKHAHFSGDPARDDDAAPWLSVLSFKEDVMEQSERLNPPYPKAPALTIGNAFNIAVEQRDGFWLDINATGYGAPRPGSALGLILGKLDAVNAAAAADEQRDNAALAAITALTALIQQGGGNVDTAGIIAAVHAVGDDTHAQIVELQEQLAAVQGRNVRLAQALAAAGGALEEADDEPAGA